MIFFDSIYIIRYCDFIAETRLSNLLTKLSTEYRFKSLNNRLKQCGLVDITVYKSNYSKVV